MTSNTTLNAKNEKLRAERLSKRLNAIRAHAVENKDNELLELLNAQDLAEDLSEEPNTLPAGSLVCKDSKNPFKSGYFVNTVADHCFNPTTGRLSYLFEEDDSCVEVRMCRAPTDEEAAGKFAGEPAVKNRVAVE